MNHLITIPAFGDNFIYLYRYDQNRALVVDPCDGSSVLRAIEEHGLDLTTILITHHHWDHTAGVADLKKQTGCEVIGADERRIPALDHLVHDEEILPAGSSEIHIIATPGHTKTSVCYYMPPSPNSTDGILWTGDTLFVAGCGRLFECNAQTMKDSLHKLTSLPDQTLVYPGHDYTVEDYECALTIEPDNQLVKDCLRKATDSQEAGGYTVPSTISQEKMTNPFLRADNHELKAAMNMADAPAVDVFAELRRRKDVF